MRLVLGISRTVVATAFVSIVSSHAFAADGGSWSVSKSSGEVWIATSDVQQASLKQDDSLKPGDMVRTGRTGRVLLTRGQETIMIAPNSVVGLPAEAKEGLSTTIVQQAGSILLEVEKRNVKHFEVETPYLAAVVKGTQFRVTVNAAATSVDVIRGQVEVADFKSGQIAQVMPGQQATSFAQGKVGLSLSGSGILNPIEQGKPRAPSVDRIPVPKNGLSAPRNASNGQMIRALGPAGGAQAKLGPNPQRNVGAMTAKHGVTRISSALGEVRLNFHKVTNGLARDASASGSSRSAANKDTVWGSSGSSTTTALSGGNQDSSYSSGSASTTIATIAGTGNSSNGNGGGNGNSGGNGNGNAYGKQANGNGNGGNGNGNANGNGNGNAYGHTKK